MRGWEWRYLSALRDQSQCRLSDEPSNCIDYSPDGKWIAAVGIGGVMKVWNADSNPPRERYAKNLPAFRYVLDLAFSPDGNRVVLVGSAKDHPLCGLIQVFETSTGALVNSRIVDELERLVPDEILVVQEMDEIAFCVEWSSNHSVVFGVLFGFYAWNT